MSDVNDALASISSMRAQITAGQRFLGFTPPVIALTGGLALALATLQSMTEGASTNTVSLLMSWIILAVLVSSLMVIEAITRAKIAHQSLADRMLITTFRQFAPIGLIGAIYSPFVMFATPDVAWLLPGLWQMLVALGLFSALPNLPKPMVWIVAFYGLMGLLSLGFCTVARFNPWIMGIPFGVGQMLVALVLHKARIDG